MDPRLPSLLRSQYGLENVEVLARFAANGRREVYLLETELGRLVLKITDPGRPEALVRGDTSILGYLSHRGFPASRPVLTRDGQQYLPFEDRFFYLYHFVEGKKPQPSAPMLAGCGRLLAQLHSIPLDETARKSLHRPAYLLAEIRSWLESAPDTHEQQRMAIELLEMVKNFPSFEGLPEGLIHTDPYYVNLLESPHGRLHLIDWEDAGVSYPLIDVGYLGHLTTFLPHDRAALAMTASDEAITWRPDWAQAFLDGYQSVRRLSRDEQALFPAAVRLNFLMYIWDWDQRLIIPENYARLKLLETFQPIWR